jgi:hypothetical protein
LIEPTRWKHPEPVSAEKLNEMVQAIREVQGNVGGQRQFSWLRPRFAVIVDEGPNGEETGDVGLTYYCKFTMPYIGSNGWTYGGDSSALEPQSDDDQDTIVLAQNLSGSGEELVPVGTGVMLFPVPTTSANFNTTGNLGRYLWVFASGVAPISGPATDTIGSTGETEAADTEVVVSANHSKVVEDIRLVRMAYSHAGDQVLYGYYRTYTYRSGILTDISAETRVTIDAPEACA